MPDDFPDDETLAPELLTLDQHHCRHPVIPTTDSDGPLLAFVGWDRPLGTFFLQVGRPLTDEPHEIDGEQMLHWVGTQWREIPTARALAAHAWNGFTGDKEIGAPWARISLRLGKHLEDYAAARPAEKGPRGFVGGELFL